MKTTFSWTLLQEDRIHNMSLHILQNEINSWGRFIALKSVNSAEEKKSVYIVSTQNINDILIVSLILFVSLGAQSE